MCVVSMVGDHYRDKWCPSGPIATPVYPQEDFGYIINRLSNNQTVTRDEFNKLANDVAEMKRLLERAVKYDKDTKQEHCEDPEKVALLKKVAQLVGVDIDEVFR